MKYEFWRAFFFQYPRENEIWMEFQVPDFSWAYCGHLGRLSLSFLTLLFEYT